MTNRLVKVKFEHGPELEVEVGVSLSQILRDHAAAREGIDYQPSFTPRARPLSP